jgi:serine/threonine-protein kinase
MRSAQPPNAAPVILENKYRLLNEIGRGAMGTVFLAEDTSLRRRVAIKFLLPELDASADCAIRFKQEAVGMASVRHNNVAQIYSYAEHGGNLYFVMEYLDGDTLENLVDAHNRRGFFIPLSSAMDMLMQAASGLAAVHRAGVVHRDIKPANIMLTDDGRRTVIMDFGLVRNVEIEHEMRSLVGTPAYMAPEIAEGRRGSDRSPQVDIYSFGVSAYEILTGSLPFNGKTWVEIVRKHITEVPSFPSERRPGLPEKLDEIIFRALSKDPNERYKTCSEMIEELSFVAQMAVPDDDRNPASITTKRRRSVGARFSSAPPRNLRSTPTSTGRGKLLVVDADSAFRSVVHEVAKSSVPGCRVYSATDGAMALKMFDEIRPNVLILDLSLPEINGLEVAATIRGDHANDAVSIIIVSETGGRREVEILNRLKINRYLVKPVDRDQLADELRPLLERTTGAFRFLTPKPKPWI